MAVERATLADILDALGDGVVVTSLEGRVTLANRAASAQLGVTLLGRSLFEFVEREPLVRLAEEFRTSEPGTVSVDLRGRAGLRLHTVVPPLADGEGRLTGLVLVLRHQLPHAALADEAAGAPAGPLVVGAGFLSGSANASFGDRPVFYDFALLDDMERHTSPAQRSQALVELVFTVVDIETTGLEPGRDRIVSLACARVRQGVVRPGEILDALVNPGRPIPPASTRIHGVTDDMVAKALTIDQILPVVARFAEGTVLVGHHVWFDLQFLRVVTDRLQLPPLTRSHAVLDTGSLSRVVHGSIGDHDLESVAARLGVAVRGRHSALGDALTTAEILSRLLSLLEKRGVRSLGQALAVTRAVGRHQALL
jgi:DNA polymerase III epsilon subunit family exonuclease